MVEERNFKSASLMVIGAGVDCGRLLKTGRRTRGLLIVLGLLLSLLMFEVQDRMKVCRGKREKL